MPSYLADTSIWAWANRKARPDLNEKLAERLERGEVCTCTPVALEVMHRAETSAQYEEIYRSLLEPLDWLPLTEQVGWRAIEVQRELASRSHGNHRRPAADYLIAATAEAAAPGVVLWFFDRLDLVASRHPELAGSRREQLLLLTELGEQALLTTAAAPDDRVTARRRLLERTRAITANDADAILAGRESDWDRDHGG